MSTILRATLRDIVVAMKEKSEEGGVGADHRLEEALIDLASVVDKMLQIDSRVQGEIDEMERASLKAQHELDAEKIVKLREALERIREWDMLNPGDREGEFLADAPWLRGVIDDVLKETR